MYYDEIPNKNIVSLDEDELKFDFPINTSEEAKYFLHSLNDKQYRDVMVCTNWPLWFD